MGLRINDIAPDFTAETTQGRLSLHEWIGDGWASVDPSNPAAGQPARCQDGQDVLAEELGHLARGSIY